LKLRADCKAGTASPMGSPGVSGPRGAVGAGQPTTIPALESGPHLVRIEPVHHPMQVGMLRAHRHEPRMPSAGKAPLACVAASDPVRPETRAWHRKGHLYPHPRGDRKPGVGMPMTLPMPAKIFTIFEGTSEIQRMLVGRAITGLDVR
jgi:hypothetical protein